MAFGPVPGFRDDDPPPGASAGRTEGMNGASWRGAAGEAPDGRRGAGAEDGEPGEGGQGSAVAAIETIDFADLAGREPPPRRFIVDQWVPARCATSLYGPGGIGKSMLAQQIATSVATGRPLFGAPVERGRVLGLLAEDDDEELWRRQVRINDWIGCGMTDLGNLHLQGRAGLENTLALYPTAGGPEVQELYGLIVGKAREVRPNLIILDPIAQLYGGNENDRFQASHFVNLVGGLAREFDCGLLLLGHPAKADGSEYSGSTAWNASVRSRLLLHRKEGEADELVLTRAKGNYAKLDSLVLRWSDGTLRPAAPEFMTYGDKLEAEMRAGAAEQCFLNGLDMLAGRGVALSDAARAGNYAPRELERHGQLGTFTRREMEAAMLSLLGKGVLVANAPIGKRDNRHQRRGLARQLQTDAGEDGA